MRPTDRTATTVTRLQRPPVCQSTLVRSDVAHTFDVFVRAIGAWWPVQPYSAGGERVRQVTFERRVGGRVYETWGDGTTVDWGEVLVWDPPAGFTISWRSTPAVTEVELVFSELGPSLTRVAVEHRGWDALTDEQLAQDCALPGGYLSGAYATGWSTILARLAHAVEADAAVQEPPR
jgi:Activator of Hsp90 ATPase homolog 1-like protein